MLSPRLIIFVTLSGAVHAGLLAIVTERARLPSDADDSLRVTLLAPDRQSAARQGRSVNSAPSSRTETQDETGRELRETRDHERAKPLAQYPPTAENLQSASARTHADVRGRKVQALVFRAFRAAFDYPLLAQRQGWQGEVRIALTVRANGQLSNVRVVQSSGYAILDAAAMRSMLQIREIPDAVALLNGQNLDVVLPIRYQLLTS